MGVVVGLGVGVGLLLVWSAFTMPRTEPAARRTSRLRRLLDRAGLVGLTVRQLGRVSYMAAEVRTSIAG
jgi:tight adherence protein B